ncbi:MAG: SDR family oxidoreductase, partial [candidate division WOR-3 bacterium]
AAVALAQAGADVVLNYVRDRQSALQVAVECQAWGAHTLTIRADVASSAAVRAMVKRAKSAFGRIDILVANAGIWEESAIERLDDQKLARTLNVNVKGVFACCREVVPLMKARRFGRIILVASTAGQRGEAFHSHYAASKGAVISLTKSLAPELARYGILVNCIAPGWFATDMSAATMNAPRSRRAVLDTIPLGRIGRPEEFAGTVLFLASDLSSFVTGEILNVNGGAVLCG